VRSLCLVLISSLFIGLDAAAQTSLPIRAARWIAPDADRMRALGSIPTECLTPGGDSYLIEIGRAAFRTPLLLGGQASRAGLSCESCHRSGRGNADFLFPGVSGAAGTADVTLSLFSAHRGDGIMNPKPIPDLSGPGEALKVSRSPEPGALETFIRGLIVEEFDGPEPAASVLTGVAAYVRALSPASCPAAAWQPLRVTQVIDDARRAARAANAALERGDKAAALLMVSAARSQLELMHERYDTAELSEHRALVRSADLDLAAVLAAIRAGDAGARDRIAVWLAQSGAWASRLEAAENKSLFAASRLAGR
jgi:hypothetical protein